MKQLHHLIQRGDQVAIVNGRLSIETASGSEPHSDWLEMHSDSLIREILETVSVDAYRYDGYYTGRYKVRRKQGKPTLAPGVTVQFTSLLTDEAAYVVFNANIDYQRGLKSGTPLPGKRFSVTKRSHFYKFWMKTHLAVPSRLGLFSDYMGNLRGVLFAGERTGERFSAGTLSPLEVRHEWLARKILPNNSRTASEHHPNNSQTVGPNKESPEPYTEWGVAPDQSTGFLNHANQSIRNTNTRGESNTPVDPRDQSHEEWLEDFS